MSHSIISSHRRNVSAANDGGKFVDLDFSWKETRWNMLRLMQWTELFACAVQCLSGNGAVYRRWIIRSNYRSWSVHWKGCRDCSAADAFSGFLHAQAASLPQRSQTWKFPLPAPWYVKVEGLRSEPGLITYDIPGWKQLCKSYWWITTTWIYQWLRHAMTINQLSHPETPELRTKGPIANTLLKIIDFGLSKCFDEGVLQM